MMSVNEADKHIPYDPKPEMKAAGAYPSLSKPSFKFDNIKFRIAKAISIVNDYKSKFPNDNYFDNANIGDGFYQVQFRHDGNILAKHTISAPSDVGTCKTFQNIARYCYVKAGKDKSSFGKSPADDATNKSLFLFRNEILDFYGLPSYVDDTAPIVSKEKMNDKQAKHKLKKDLEDKLNRRLTDTEWLSYLETGVEPKPKSTLSMDPSDAAEFERKQAEIKARILAAKEKRKLKL
jgi:hypothetical protein